MTVAYNSGLCTISHSRKSRFLLITIFNSVQSLSHVRLFATPWTAACQASLSITNSQSLLKLMSIESVVPSNHLIFCHPLLLPSIFPSIRVFSNESALRIRWPQYWVVVKSVNSEVPLPGFKSQLLCLPAMHLGQVTLPPSASLPWN